MKFSAFDPWFRRSSHGLGVRDELQDQRLGCHHIPAAAWKKHGLWEFDCGSWRELISNSCSPVFALCGQIVVRLCNVHRTDNKCQGSEIILQME
jgi:hypothetical protein